MASSSKLPFWRRRSYQAMAAVLGVLIVAALGGNFYLSQQYQPAGAVSQYLTALETRDARSAWALAQIQTPSGSIGASLLDLSAMQRSFAVGAPDIKGFDITGVAYSDSEQTSASVSVSYQTSAGMRQTTFTVVRGPNRNFGIYPSWLVVVQPAIINLTFLPAAETLVLDGRTLQVSTPTKSIAVWPLRHRITFPGTAVLAGQTVDLNVFDTTNASVVAEPSLTEAGQTKALAAIKDAFVQCAAETSLQPAGCPQHFDAAFASTGSWSLVGDPTRGVAIAFDEQENLVGSGHYQMVLAYQDSDASTLHAAVGGGFAAQLGISPSDVIVVSLAASSDVPALQRPAAATDDAIKAVVSKAISACAAIRSGSPSDCPQQFVFPDATVQGWTLSGDPLQTATVTFDQASGLFDVHGTFAMTVSYELYSYPGARASSTTTYDAVVLWTGSALQVVTISGGYN